MASDTWEIRCPNCGRTSKTSKGGKIMTFRGKRCCEGCLVEAEEDRDSLLRRMLLKPSMLGAIQSANGQYGRSGKDERISRAYQLDIDRPKGTRVYVDYNIVSEIRSKHIAKPDGIYVRLLGYGIWINIDRIST